MLFQGGLGTIFAIYRTSKFFPFVHGMRMPELPFIFHTRKPFHTSWSCKSGWKIPDIGREVPWGNADPRIIEQLFAAAGAGMSPFEQGRLQLSEERIMTLWRFSYGEMVYWESFDDWICLICFLFFFEALSPKETQIQAEAWDQNF